MLRFPRAPTDLSVRVGCRLPRHRRRRPFVFPPTGFPSILSSCRSILPRRRRANPPLTRAFFSTDIIDDSDDYVTDVEEEESTLLPDSQVDVNATLRAAARAARIKKMEQFRRETGLAAFSERVEASLPQRRKAAAPAPVAIVAPAPAAAAAPAPAPLDRGVEAKQPWIARLFGVKGKSTVKYLCFAVSRGRTLRKVIAQLHAWRSHGIEELVADPKRGMVWVTVSAKNCEYFSFFPSCLLFLFTAIFTWRLGTDWHPSVQLSSSSRSPSPLRCSALSKKSTMSPKKSPLLESRSSTGPLAA